MSIIAVFECELDNWYNSYGKRYGLNAVIMLTNYE